MQPNSQSQRCDAWQNLHARLGLGAFHRAHMSTPPAALPDPDWAACDLHDLRSLSK